MLMIFHPKFLWIQATICIKKQKAAKIVQLSFRLCWVILTVADGRARSYSKSRRTFHALSAKVKPMQALSHLPYPFLMTIYSIIIVYHIHRRNASLFWKNRIFPQFARHTAASFWKK